MPEARPGGNRQIVGTVTVRYVTEGTREAIASGERYRNIVQAIMEGSDKMAQSASMSQLARDMSLAEVASNSVKNSTDQFFNALQKHGGDFSQLSEKQLKHYDEAKKGTEKLLKAAMKAATEGRELFNEQRLKELMDYNKELDKHGDNLEGTLKSQVKINEAKEDFWKKMKSLKDEILPGFGQIMSTIYSALPDGLGDSKDAIDILGAGVKKTTVFFQKGNAIIKAFVKTGKDVKGAGGSIKGLTGQFSKLGGSAGRAGGVLARVGPAIAALGPYALVAVAALIVLAVALAAVVVVMAAWYVAIQLGIKGLKKLAALQEEFRLSAYSSIGTVRELTQATTELGVSTGLGSEAAKDAIKSLVAAGMGADSLRKSLGNASASTASAREELKSFAEVTMEFNRSTKIGYGEIARYTKALSVMGLRAKDVKAAMGGMLQVQRIVGLSQKGLTKVMGIFSSKLSTIAAAFPKTNAQKFSKDLAVLAAKAEQSGAGLEALDSLVGKITAGFDRAAITAAAFSGRMDEFMKTEDLGTATEIVADGLKNLVGQMRASGLEGQRFLGVMKNLGFNMKEVQVAMYELGELTGDALKQFEETKALDEFNARFTASTNTLLQSLKQIFEPLMSMVIEAVQPFAEELQKLGPVLKEMLLPLWYELKWLVADIFGVKFAGSGNLKKTLEGVIGFLKSAIHFARDMWNMFKGVVSAITAMWEVWNAIPKWLKAIMIGAVNPLAGAAYAAIALYDTISGASDNALKKEKERQKDLAAAQRASAQERIQVEQEAADSIDKRRQKSMEEKVQAFLRESEQIQGRTGAGESSLSNFYASRGQAFGGMSTGAWSRGGGGTDGATAYFQEKVAAQAVARGEGGVGAVPGAEDVSEIPTVKHTEETKSSKVNYMKLLVERTEETNSILHGILTQGEEGPAVEVLKDLFGIQTDMMTAGKMFNSHRRSSTMGSRSTQWGSRD